MKKVNKIYNQGKNYEVHAIKDIDLEINEGEMIAITGPSGSGKSTLLHILAGISRATSGEYYFDGEDVSKMSDSDRCKIRNKKIGIIMQDFGLLGDDTVIRNVCLPQMISGEYNKAVVEKAKRMLHIMGLDDVVKKKVNQLSGGQKQRVAIARALTMNAKVIIADEPTGALDIQNTEKLMKLFREINRQGISIIIVTHNLLVADFCPIRYTLTDGVIKRAAAESEG
ncbi:MAG: ABC transporter ATP-binding protein [Clostridium sp.]|nr:ABC transporter ATP-binding protein [Clostridium sp.]MCM1171641.1 ABC transporter ATP-binding protein [Clostridium sp.]MCM1209161.1 ABC transporter ATP-binding protein [Ruminococcus sp.]